MAKGTAQKRRRALAESSDEESDFEDEEMEESAEEDEEEEEEEDGEAPRTRGRPAAKKARGAALSDDEDASDGEFRDEWASDLMGDDADREHLAAMTEMQREIILTERADTRERAKLLWETRRKEKEDARAREAQPSKPAARASVRQRGLASTGEDGTRAALSRMQKDKQRRELKRQGLPEPAEEEEEEEEGAEADRPRGRGRRDDSDYEEEDGSDEDEGGGRRHRRGRSEGEEDDDEEDDRGREEDEAVYRAAPLDSIRRACVTRDQLEKWHEQPALEEKLAGAFVRVSIGQGAGGARVYRLARIRAVVDGEAVALEAAAAAAREAEERGEPPPPAAAGPPLHKGTKLRPYMIVPGAPGGRPTSTYLELEIGSSTRVTAISVLSNAPFEEGEYIAWAAHMKKAELRPPSVEEIKHVVEGIEQARTYTYTAETVAYLLERKKEAGKMAGAKVTLRHQLAEEAQFAEESGDAATAARLRARLLEIDATIGREESARERRTAHLATINKRNTEHNFQAILAHREKGAMMGGAAVVESDPYSRRPTRPTSLWAHNKKAAAAAAAGGGAAPAAAAEDAAALTRRVSLPAGDGADGGAGAFETPRGPDGGFDLAALLTRVHDVEVDIDLGLMRAAVEASKAAGGPAGAAAARRAAAGAVPVGGPPPPGRPVISYMDWKRRQGIIT